MIKQEPIAVMKALRFKADQASGFPKISRISESSGEGSIGRVSIILSSSSSCQGLSDGRGDGVSSASGDMGLIEGDGCSGDSDWFALVFSYVGYVSAGGGTAIGI